jgi:hypothetical protein
MFGVEVEWRSTIVGPCLWADAGAKEPGTVMLEGVRNRWAALAHTAVCKRRRAVKKHRLFLLVEGKLSFV